MNKKEIIKDFLHKLHNTYRYDIWEDTGYTTWCIDLEDDDEVEELLKNVYGDKE